MYTFITFLFLFSFVVQTICLSSLKCLGKQDPNNGQLSSCSFTLTKLESIPKDSQLIQPPISCQMVVADSNLKNQDTDGFCFAEVILNDERQERTFSLEGAMKNSTKNAKFVGMMGSTADTHQTIQYAGYMDFNKNQSELALRVQCKTEENCAWKILIGLLSTITKVNLRWTLFHRIKSDFYNENPNQGPTLTCVTSNDIDDVNCTQNHDRCYRRISEMSPIQIGCAGSTIVNNDLEFQQNFAKPIGATTANQLPSLYRLTFACRRKYCNSNIQSKDLSELLLGFFSPQKLPENLKSQSADVSNTMKLLSILFCFMVIIDLKN